MGHHFDISRYPASGARLVASDLVDGCRAMRGIDTGFAVSEGQLGLARWLADRRMTIANGNFADLRASLLYDGDLVERLLAGEIVPDDKMAADIQRMTQDAVRPQHWEMWLSREGPGYIPCASSPYASHSKRLELQVPRGQLGGDLPSGPVFEAYSIAGHNDAFVVTGCGLALSLNDATAAALIDAVALGRARLRSLRGDVKSAGALAA